MRNKQILLLFILLTFACNRKKFGDVLIEVFPEQAKIDINNLPYGQTGIHGFNTITYPEGFSFEDIDEAIYDYLVSKNFNNNIVAINIRYGGKDGYGKDTLGKLITIGHLNIEESKKYASFADWKRKYNVFNLIQTRVATKTLQDQSSSETITPSKIKETLLMPDPEDLTTAQNIEIIASKSNLEIDRDNGVGQLKFGMTIAEIGKVCKQSKLKKIKGMNDTYFADLLTNSFYLSGRKVEAVRVVYYKGVLLRIFVTLKPYVENAESDDEDSKYRTGNEDVYQDISNKYGSWGVMLETGEEEGYLAYSIYEIQGKYARIQRKEWKLLLQSKQDDVELMCPGDVFTVSSILLEDWQKADAGK